MLEYILIVIWILGLSGCIVILWDWRDEKVAEKRIAHLEREYKRNVDLVAQTTRAIWAEMLERGNGNG